jgi:hypothetical protein
MGMKNIQDLLVAMRAAGCSPEQILSVIDHQAGLEAEKLKEHRAKRAEQKRLERARKVEMSPDVAATGSMSQRQHECRSDPLSLNGSPPTPYIRNIDTPPSLNPITNIRPRELKGFDLFWSAYPRREGKGRAEKAWVKAVRLASPENIVEAVHATKWAEEKQFIPLPASWLNDRRWEDELAGMRPRRASEAELEAEERSRLEILNRLNVQNGVKVNEH